MAKRGRREGKGRGNERLSFEAKHAGVTDVTFALCFQFIRVRCHVYRQDLIITITSPSKTALPTNVDISKALQFLQGLIPPKNVSKIYHPK
jgi:hypothetical protein